MHNLPLQALFWRENMGSVAVIYTGAWETARHVWANAHMSSRPG